MAHRCQQGRLELVYLALMRDIAYQQAATDGLIAIATHIEEPQQERPRAVILARFQQPFANFASLSAGQATPIVAWMLAQRCQPLMHIADMQIAQRAIREAEQRTCAGVGIKNRAIRAGEQQAIVYAINNGAERAL